MDKASARHLLADARVAVLATISPEGIPHLVPVCFVLAGATAYSAVDDVKPKSTLALHRLENVRANAATSLLAHNYDEDWSRLWWVRVHGTGRVIDGSDERTGSLALLAAKYEQYKDSPPPGEVLAVDIERWRWWP